MTMLLAPCRPAEPCWGCQGRMGLPGQGLVSPRSPSAPSPESGGAKMVPGGYTPPARLGAFPSHPADNLSPQLHGEDLRLPLIAFLIWSYEATRPSSAPAQEAASCRHVGTVTHSPAPTGGPRGPTEAPHPPQTQPPHPSRGPPQANTRFSILQRTAFYF